MFISTPFVRPVPKKYLSEIHQGIYPSGTYSEKDSTSMSMDLITLKALVAKSAKQLIEVNRVKVEIPNMSNYYLNSYIVNSHSTSIAHTYSNFAMMKHW